MLRNFLLMATLAAAVALAGCADTDESTNDPDALGDPEDDGLDVGDENDTMMNDTSIDTSTDTTTTTDTGVYGG